MEQNNSNIRQERTYGRHLTKDPPADDSKEQWMEEDARLFIQIRNSIDN